MKIDFLQINPRRHIVLPAITDEEQASRNLYSAETSNILFRKLTANSYDDFNNAGQKPEKLLEKEHTKLYFHRTIYIPFTLFKQNTDMKDELFTIQEKGEYI